MFKSSDEAKKQILKDKHTLLEGYVPEFLFEQQFLKSTSTRYAKGWWIATCDYGSQYIAFCYSDSISDIDLIIANQLSVGMPVWFVKYEDSWHFTDIAGTRCLKLEDFLLHNNIRQRYDQIRATNATRNRERQNMCIRFFEEKGILLEVAMQRRFADDFLSVYFGSVVNIDFFSINKSGAPCVIEVKFKYPARDGSYGFDKGLGDAFDYLSQVCNFQIFHFILAKTVASESMSIFDILTDPRIEKYWVYTKLTNISDNPIRYAPEKTSVDGKKRQMYYRLDSSLFKQYRKLIY